MKINFDRKKIAEATAEIVQKTVDTGKRVAVGGGGVSLSSQAENEHHSKLIFHIEF